jgi:dolichyl-phosphate-mannose--protein O-mannosyl transferase
MVNSLSLALGLASLLSAFHTRTFLAAALLGGAVAVKLSGLVFLPLVVLALCKPQGGPHTPRMLLRSWLGVILLAVTVYVASYAMLLRSDVLSFFQALWRYHYVMLEHHLNAIEPHRYESAWWTWPVSLRPIWYGFERLSDSTRVRGILCIANPVSSLVVILGVFVALIRMVAGHRPTKGEIIAMMGFVCSLFPWSLSPRTTMYHYYYVPLVFGVMMFALEIDRLKANLRNSILAGVMLCSLALFIYWYPLWSVLPIPAERFESMMWLDSWR